MNYFENIPNSTLAYIIVGGVLGFLIILISILSIVRHVRNKKEEKLIEEQSNELLEAIEESIPEAPSMNLTERLHFTTEFLEFIDSLIELELIYFKKDEIFIKDVDGNSAKVKNTDFDKVISDVAIKVFEGLKSELYSAADNILTDKYILSYIQKKTVISYLTYIESKLNESV